MSSSEESINGAKQHRPLKQNKRLEGEKTLENNIIREFNGSKLNWPKNLEILQYSFFQGIFIVFI